MTIPASIQQYLSVGPEIQSWLPQASGAVRTMAAGSQQTAAIGTATSGFVQSLWVDVVADTDCFIEIGANPTAAVNTGYYIVAFLTYRFPITPGNKIAVIPKTGATGNLWYHPVA